MASTVEQSGDLTALLVAAHEHPVAVGARRHGTAGRTKRYLGGDLHAQHRAA
jgi:metallophosphoesterase superfamily enzyme